MFVMFVKFVERVKYKENLRRSLDIEMRTTKRAVPIEVFVVLAIFIIAAADSVYWCEAKCPITFPAAST